MIAKWGEFESTEKKKEKKEEKDKQSKIHLLISTKRWDGNVYAGYLSKLLNPIEINPSVKYREQE